MHLPAAVRKLLPAVARDSPAPQVGLGTDGATQEIAGEAPHYRWVVMGLWITCSVAGFMMVATLGIMLPAISDDLRLSPSQQGLLASAAFFGSVGLAIPLTWWASRFGPKILTTVTLIVGGLFLVLQAWAPAFAVLIGGRVGFGLALLAREPARAHLMQQWFPKREVILVNSVNTAVFGVVVGAGLMLTPLILNSVGDSWRTVLYFFAAVFAVLTLVWMAFGRERVTQEYRARQAAPREAGLLRGALGYRDLWIGGLGFVGATLAWSAFLSFYPTLLLDEHDISLQWSGIVLALGIMVGGGAGLGVGYVVMMMDRRKTILLVLGLVMAGTYMGMTQSGSILLLVVLSFVNGIAWGFWPILQTVPFQLPGIRPREVAVALGLTMTMISVGTMLGPLVTGLLQEAVGDLSTALLIVSFAPLSLSAAGLLLRLRADTAGADSPPVR